MTVSIMPAPSYRDLVYGPAPFQKFDYYPNPQRLSSGKNPVLFMAHAGAGTVGTYQWFRNSSDTYMWDFLRWLLGDFAGSVPALPFDVVAFSSAQRKHTAVGTATIDAIARSRAVFGIESIIDAQFAIARIKALLPLLGGDPNDCHGLGESHGAWKLFLSQLFAAVALNGYDSKLRSLISSGAPIDFRGGYFDYRVIGGMTGTRTDNPGEFNNLSDEFLNRLSIIRYFEDRELAGYCPTYLSYVQAGDGVLPLGDVDHVGSDPHDSRQFTDLANAINDAGFPVYGEILSSSSLLVNANYPSAPTGTTFGTFRRFYSFLENQALSAA